jgi:HK97 gp10 family phage protein
MASAKFKLPKEFLDRCDRLGSKLDTILPEVLEEGGKVVLQTVKRNLAGVVGKGLKGESRSTGELERSLGVTPAKPDKNGVWNVKIGFAEPRSDGSVNAKIASVLEYGKVGQPPKPFLAPAKTQSKTAAINAMIKKMDSECQNI